MKLKILILAILLWASQASAAFVFTNLYNGATNGDGTGDRLYVAGAKINTNFYYLTNSVGLVSNSVVVLSNATVTASNALNSLITADSFTATNTFTLGFRINPLIAATRWTNDAQRATLELEASLTDAVGGIPKFSLTIEHGTQATNNWQLSPIGGGLGATLTTPVTNKWSFELSPSAVVLFTDTSSGGASAAISRSVVFRK